MGNDKVHYFELPLLCDVEMELCWLSFHKAIPLYIF